MGHNYPRCGDRNDQAGRSSVGAQREPLTTQRAIGSLPTVSIHYLDKKDLIRNELTALAKEVPLRCLTYGEFGARVGIPARGPWKKILDLIASEELTADRPDITFLVINSKTGYPGQIDFEPASPPSQAQRRSFEAMLKRIAAHYGAK
jgi:hypothetical protein